MLKHKTYLIRFIKVIIVNFPWKCGATVKNVADKIDEMDQGQKLM